MIVGITSRLHSFDLRSQFAKRVMACAYETVAGEPIKAGDEGNAVSALPSTFGSLALGSEVTR